MSIQFDHVLDSLLEGIQIIGFDWKYKYVNDSLVRQSGYTREELIGFTMMERYPGIEQSETFMVLRKTMNERVPQHLENEFVFPDNTRRWFELSVQPIKEGIIVLSVDITDRKQAEAHVQELNTRLEQRVKERTKELESINQDMESFSYSVSHDLRAPLRAVSGYAKMIEEDYRQLFDDEGKRLLSAIQHNAEKMSSLIDDLLTFSRLGRKEIQKTMVDMQQLAEGALLELGKTMQIKADVQIKKLHPAPADYLLINQVFVNLISNAIKYSSKAEHPEVVISSTKRDKEIIYSLRDNGIGFDMKYYDKLFQVFQRLHSIEDFEGTGVGLASAKRIVNKHGGEIWAVSQPGEGAVFSFSLPLQ